MNKIKSGYYRSSALVLGAMLIYSLYLIFMGVPNERTMGAVQRIMYFHVASAIACYLSSAIVFFGGIYYLATKSLKADTFSEAAGEVGFLFCSITLISGMIWGHSAWNTWFRWEPRLVTFLLLWFIFLSFNLLRKFGDKQRTPQHSAVLGILGAITVPLVIFSVYFMPGVPQLHPKEVVMSGLEHSMYKVALWFSVLTLCCLQFLLVFFRAKIGELEREILK